MSRVRSDKFTNRAATGPCTFTDGLNVTDTTANTIGVEIGMGGIVAVAGTFSGNVSVAGTLTYEDVTNVDSTGIVTAKGGVDIPVDDKKITFGAGTDLEIYHGSNNWNYITSPTSRNLSINPVTSEAGLQVLANAGVHAFYDNSEKIKTTTDGVEVTGGIIASGMLNEGVNITAGKLSDNTNIDLANGMVHLFTTAETATSTPNFRFDGSNTLASKMDVGDTVTLTVITTTTSTSYYSAEMTIDGAAQTEEWLGGSAPSAGSGSGYDVYTYNIIKTAATPTYVVLANLSNFA